MTLYALEDVDDALAVTREFLTPIDRTVWIKLAFVVFFIGGPGANFNSFQYSFGGNGGDGGVSPPPGQGFPPEIGPRILLLIAAIVGAALLLGLLFALVGSIMEFVFVESLRNEAVTIRQYWSQRWKQGVRLFGFRLAIGILVIGTLLLLTVPLVLPMFGIAGGASLALLVLLIPFFLIAALVVGLINGFTTVFVVPIMVLEDCNVLAGWRRLWPTITSQWQQYLAYAIGGFVLSLLGGIAIAIALGVSVLLLLVPFGILFAISFGIFTLTQPLGIGLLVVVGILFVLSIIVVAALLQVPVQTYLRYYALLVLGDIDAEFDLIPEQRAAVREEVE